MNTDKLKKLFDYQRFEKNNNLERLIRESESRYSHALCDEDLELVSAAGEPGLEFDPGISNDSFEGNIGTGGGLGDKDPGFEKQGRLCTYDYGQKPGGSSFPVCSDYQNKGLKPECKTCPARFN